MENSVLEPYIYIFMKRKNTLKSIKNVRHHYGKVTLSIKKKKLLL